MAILTALQDQIDDLTDSLSAQQRTMQRLLDSAKALDTETGATAHGVENSPAAGQRR